MGTYCLEIYKVEKHFQGLEIHYIPRDQNSAADFLAKLGLDRAKVPLKIFVKELEKTIYQRVDFNFSA